MDDLAKLAGTVRQLADQAAMTLVPAVPETDLGSEVCLGPAELDLPAFLDIACKHGGGLLYLRANPFDPADDEHEVSEPPAHLARRKGQIGHLSVAFAANGIVHVWQDRAAWYTEWQQLANAQSSRKDYDEDDEDEQHTDQERAQLAELVDALLADPEFRAAKATARRRVGEAAMPGETNRGWSSWRIISAACDRAEELAGDKYRELYARIDELAPELAAEPEFQRSRTAPARKQVTERFLISHADGFSGPTYVREELCARAQQLVKAASGKNPGSF
ncbi:hypothetical protein [Microbispora sp. NBRC 16548]|uniref:hypothetical protein n=1 Tax=Microbispora sp. NBRC 16548 TaxID=3030994 RepID=UPI00249FBF12|nr:hypothetical protein [Microbispora sp. NBRC 16548]GLX06578.1 hypothetical protein Misp03_35050 [Microbispora sp. NBRC 16548]